MTEKVDPIGSMIRLAMLSEQDEDGEWVVRTRVRTCPSCRRGYNEPVRDPLTSCPFCNADLSPDPAEPYDMQQARNAMRDICGKLKDAMEDK